MFDVQRPQCFLFFLCSSFALGFRANNHRTSPFLASISDLLHDRTNISNETRMIFNFKYGIDKVRSHRKRACVISAVFGSQLLRTDESSNSNFCRVHSTVSEGSPLIEFEFSLSSAPRILDFYSWIWLEAKLTTMCKYMKIMKTNALYSHKYG